MRLKDQLIKLGQRNPSLRPHLRPVLACLDKKAGEPTHDVDDEAYFFIGGGPRKFETIVNIITRALGDPDEIHLDGEPIDLPLTWESAQLIERHSDDGWTWNLADGSYIFIAYNPLVVGGTYGVLEDLGILDMGLRPW